MRSKNSSGFRSTRKSTSACSGIFFATWMTRRCGLLTAALRPWLHPGTKAHGFGVHHLAIRLENIQYGVVDKDTLSIRERRSAQLPSYPHSQIEMHEMMNCFDFERGLLLPEGKLEMLLKTEGLTAGIWTNPASISSASSENLKKSPPVVQGQVLA